MELALRVRGQDTEQEVRSLWEWLRTDRGVRRGARVELAASQPPVPGQQGSLADMVSVVIGHGLSAASLGVAVVSWRATRPRRPVVTVERPDGTKITIAGDSPEEAQRLIQRLLGDQDA